MLPPLGLQTGVALSGITLRGLEPRGGLNPQGKNTTSEHGADPPAQAEARGGTFIDGHQTRTPDALPPAQV